MQIIKMIKHSNHLMEYQIARNFQPNEIERLSRDSGLGYIEIDQQCPHICYASGDQIAIAKALIEFMD